MALEEGDTSIGWHSYYHQIINMKIFVGNLHENTSEHALRDLFNHYGEVLSVSIPIDEKGKSSGYGYVEMKDEIEGAKAVKQLNRINFMNQFLDVHKVGLK